MKLAVFDCDGTLLNSQQNILAAMAEGFEQLGLAPPDPAAVRRIIGLSLNQAARALLPDTDAGTHQRLADAYRGAFRRLRAAAMLHPEPLFDGMGQLLERLSASGFLLAVATGKSDRGLELSLRHHGIRQHFLSLQTADRHPSKPHPSMLLQCLADAGVTPGAACIVGDTVFDVEMGKAAKVRAIGVGWGYHPAEELLRAGAAGVANDASQLYELIAGRA